MNTLAEFGSEDYRLMGKYRGVVVDNNDPEKLGRIKFMVPGVVEPESPWAYPHGTLGGGSAARGFFAVPEIGADVTVHFDQGDPDIPMYQSGNWGDGEPPEFLADIDTADAPKVVGMQFGPFFLLFDTREGKEAFVMKDRDSGDGMEYDHVERSWSFVATNKLYLKAANVIIEGTGTTINGRPVSIGKKAL